MKPLELFSDYPTLTFTLSWQDQNENDKKAVMESASPPRVPPPRWDLVSGASDFSAAFEKCKVFQRGAPKGWPFAFPFFMSLCA